jgi:hypothetical protein
MMRNQQQDLTVERGLIVFDSASFTEIPECSLDMYNSPEIQAVLMDVCMEIWVTADTRIPVRKTDGTLCYLRCR